MVTQGGIAGAAEVAGWSRALGALHERVGRRFARSEAWERVKRYLLGLLGRVERKNGWQIAEAIGERDPQGVQRLLNSARWDAEAVGDETSESTCSSTSATKGRACSHRGRNRLP